MRDSNKKPGAGELGVSGLASVSLCSFPVKWDQSLVRKEWRRG